jgi:predicted PhzF superfamily epimerase YddE/YHI9
MSVEIFQVDAFTRTPFRGHPAAVCILNESRERAWMQHVARDRAVTVLRGHLLA